MSEKEKDINQIIRYLTNTFNNVTSKFERPFRGKNTGPNSLYKLQTDFSYYLNEIVLGPKCLVQYNITKCNEFIDNVISGLNNQTTKQ